MHILDIRTSQKCEFIDITDRVNKHLEDSGFKEGICFIFAPHTTAGVTVNENCDPDVIKDIISHLDKIVPWNDRYTHSEGNSAAHIKASIIGASVELMVKNGKLQLGTWQGIYFTEFDGPRNRKIYIDTK